jgi:hypothetical protein
VDHDSTVTGTVDVEAVFRDERVRLLRIATAITLDRAVAEEVVQEAFAGLHRRRDAVDNPGAYVQRSVVNLSLKFRRRVAISRSYVPPPHVQTSLGLAADGIVGPRTLTSLGLGSDEATDYQTLDDFVHNLVDWLQKGDQGGLPGDALVALQAWGDSGGGNEWYDTADLTQGPGYRWLAMLEVASDGVALNGLQVCITPDLRWCGVWTTWSH